MPIDLENAVLELRRLVLKVSIVETAGCAAGTILVCLVVSG